MKKIITDTNTMFRCPFQIKGEKEKTIIEVTLDEDQENRLRLISAAFQAFHETPGNISIRFTLPPSLLAECSSLKQLRAHIVPYQSEIIAAELDYRLRPFMAYQMVGRTKEELFPEFEKNTYKFITAHLLQQVMLSQGYQTEGISGLAEWIGTIMLTAMVNGVKSPQFYLDDESRKRYLTVSLGSVTLHPEDFEEITGPGKNNRNCFGIVTCPFYPQEFGRYHETIQIVMSRMGDFFILPSEQRRKIRQKCNGVYQQHGIVINNLEEDKQSDGLWIPEYATIK